MFPASPYRRKVSRRLSFSGPSPKRRPVNRDDDTKFNRVVRTPSYSVRRLEDLLNTDIENNITTASLSYGTALFPNVTRRTYDCVNDVTATPTGTNFEVAALKAFNWRNVWSETTYSTWRFSTSFLPKEAALWASVYTQALVPVMRVKYRFRWAADIDAPGAGVQTHVYPRAVRMYCGVFTSIQHCETSGVKYAYMPAQISSTQQTTVPSIVTSYLTPDGYTPWCTRVFKLKDFGPTSANSKYEDMEQAVATGADPWGATTQPVVYFYLYDNDSKSVIPAPVANAYYYPKIQCVVSYDIMYYGRKNIYSYDALA